jgi:DNA (cytosine-5)-methyltransferase 1
LHAIVTKDRHVVVSLEKTSFIADHCHQDVYNRVEEPITPILTWENKRYVNVCGQFINDYYGRHNTAHSLDGPANTITAENSKNIVSVHGNFITKYYKGDYHNQPTGIPYPTITTIDHNALVNVKGNFIAHQQNSNVQSCNSPLHTITSTPKQQLISHSFECTNEAAYNEIIQEIIEEKIQFLNDYFTVSKDIIEAIRKGTFDFDIKMRFVYPEELSQISSFPAKYFTDPRLKLTKKEQVRLIGNAVPPEWARIILEPVIEEIKRYKASQLINQKLAKAL